MKRKNTPLAELDPEPPSKRPRCRILEHGFADLTLDSPVLGYNTDQPPSLSAAPHVAEVFDLPSVSMDAILPAMVEEPAVPDVKMKSSSWYELEPDRIVITDLDSSSDEDEDPDTTTISISPALLERIRLRPVNIPPTPSLPSQALVLFRPLPHTIKEEAKVERTEDKERDEDAMDIEPYFL